MFSLRKNAILQQHAVVCEWHLHLHVMDPNPLANEVTDLHQLMKKLLFLSANITYNWISSRQGYFIRATTPQY